MKTHHRTALTLLGVIIAISLLRCSCSSAIVRDEAVYQTEIDLMEQMALQPVDSLNGFVKQYCTCTNGKWVSKTCAKAAKLILVVKTRVPYHKAMMLYNAGLLEERPPKDPPEVPAAETLCP